MVHRFDLGAGSRKKGQDSQKKSQSGNILHGVEFPMLLLIFAWALQQCSAIEKNVMLKTLWSSSELIVKTTIDVLLSCVCSYLLDANVT